MPKRTYKELVEVPALSEADLESAMQRFMATGGNIQIVDEDVREVRKQRNAAIKKGTRYDCK